MYFSVAGLPFRDSDVHVEHKQTVTAARASCRDGIKFEKIYKLRDEPLRKSFNEVIIVYF